MRHSIYILTLLLTTTVFGQTKDRRAELDINGRVNEISVSPDEKIWLVTAIGNIYYTDNIDSNWHYGKPIFESPDELGLGNPHLERISYFNKDTAIMTGYISVSKKEYKKNGYYLTKDAGKTWKLLDFGGDSWIYNVFVDKQGNAWMGGSSGEIFFSKDFGQHWEKLNSPYNSSSRMHSIFMLNSTTGISGALHNDIYTTSDNWKSNKKIKTPYDQKKYSTPNGYSDDRIEKILIWNNFIVVNQNGHIYYTESNNIDWQPFPIKVYDFELDNDSKTLFAISDSLKIVSLTSPTEFHLLTDKQLSSYPIDIKVVNGSLFVVSSGYEVYKVNKNGLTRSIPYTTDKKIEEPQIVKQGIKLVWGTNGNQIYLADDNKRDWYRENALDFYIRDFRLLNDSVAILWDGKKNNYLYSLSDHTPKQYFPETPLKTFLASPIKTFIINSGSQGCFHGYNDEVRYERVNDSIFKTSTASANGFREKKSSNFKNKISSSVLKTVLTDISSNPSAIPTFKDFHITDSDKKNYLTMVDNQLKSKETDYFDRKKKINKNFYYSVPAMLDTLDNSIIQSVLNQTEGGWSTTSNWFTVQIINQNNDTLNIVRSYYMKTLPWNLPWKFEYNGQHFNCYNIDFSRFINACIPDNFTDKGVFNNSRLIMEVADYLWNKEE
ncbi:MAG: hypothetical protein LC115_05470 [Bacteroidia bacterium]|nr:hypothetical protein [Bacteroidia bacterium]